MSVRTATSCGVHGTCIGVDFLGHRLKRDIGRRASDVREDWMRERQACRFGSFGHFVLASLAVLV